MAAHFSEQGTASHRALVVLTAMQSSVPAAATPLAIVQTTSSSPPVEQLAIVQTNPLTLATHDRIASIPAPTKGSAEGGSLQSEARIVEDIVFLPPKRKLVTHPSNPPLLKDSRHAPLATSPDSSPPSGGLDLATSQDMIDLPGTYPIQSNHVCENIKISSDSEVSDVMSSPDQVVSSTEHILPGSDSGFNSPSPPSTFQEHSISLSQPQLPTPLHQLPSTNSSSTNSFSPEIIPTPTRPPTPLSLSNQDATPLAAPADLKAALLAEMHLAIASASAIQNTAMQNAIQSSQAAFSSQIGDHLLATVTRTITDLDQRLSNQSDVLSAQIASLVSSQKELSASHAVSQNSIASLASKLDAITATLAGPQTSAPSPDTNNVVAPPIARVPPLSLIVDPRTSADPTILKIHSPDAPVTRTQLSSLLTALHRHVDPSTFTLLTMDDTPSKYHSLRFGSLADDAAVARLRIAQLMQTIRISKGKYEKFFATDGSPLYLNPDKGPVEAKLSFAFRKLKPLLVPQTGPQLRFDWNTGRVSSNWVGIVDIAFDPDDNPSLTWAPKNAADLKIDTSQVTETWCGIMKGSRRVESFL